MPPKRAAKKADVEESSGMNSGDIGNARSLRPRKPVTYNEAQLERGQRKEEKDKGKDVKPTRKAPKKKKAQGNVEAEPSDDQEKENGSASAAEEKEELDGTFVVRKGAKLVKKTKAGKAAASGENGDFAGKNGEPAA